MDTEGQKRTDSSYWGILSALAGSGVLFAALLFLPGFLSLRAYYNMLGLPVDLAISYLDYLVAGVRFFASSLLSAAFFIIVAMIPVIVVSATLPWLGSCTRVLRFGHAVRRASQRPMIFVLLNMFALGLLAYDLLLFREPLNGRNLLFVGAIGEMTNYTELEAFCVVSIAVSCAVVMRLNRKRRSGRVLSAMLLILLAAELLLLPMDYGALQIPTDFPTVQEIGGAAARGHVFLLGRDAAGNNVIYNRERRTIALVPGNTPLVLGRREDVLR